MLTPYLVLPSSTLKVARLLQPAKTFSSMEVVPFGMVMLSNPELRNASEAMAVSVAGRVTDLSDSVPLKAPLPILVTLLKVTVSSALS